MLKITITKSPAIRLFDRMPMPRGKIRGLIVSRRRLSEFQIAPFQRKVSKIK